MSKNFRWLGYVFCFCGFLYYLIVQLEVTKEKLVNQSDVIAIALVNSVQCPPDRNCKSYTINLAPTEMIKGKMPARAIVKMRKG